MASDSELLPALRIGGVSYLNSRPLLDQLPGRVPGSVLMTDVPARLADGLAAGQLDVGLLPIFESFRIPSADLIGDACVACMGPVRSVKLYFRVPPSRVTTLATDEGSRTSQALARVLLRQQWGLHPRISPLPLEADWEHFPGDALLVIGDRAMREPRASFVETWDLGERWYNHTGLPMVFAAWTVAPSVSQRIRTPLAKALELARDEGVARIPVIAAREAPRLSLRVREVMEYLNLNLHFTLGPAERRGLAAFRQACHETQLLAAADSPLLVPTSTTDDFTTSHR